MTDRLPRLAPRSVGAVVDLELLRVARTELDAAETAATLTLADRIRGLAAFRVSRADEDEGEVVRLGRID